jgi:putative DNA primase/helicase
VGGEEGFEVRIVNRAGWKRRDAAGRWEYLVLSTVWAKEVCAGMDPKEAARALKAAGLLRTESNSRLTVKQRIAGHNRPRVYQVLGAILDGVEDGEGEEGP